jgi:hypothetical protein
MRRAISKGLPWLIVLLFLFLDLPLYSQQPPEKSVSTINLQIPEQHNGTPLWFRLVEVMLWPFVVFAAVVIFRKPATELLQAFANRGADFTVAGVAIRLPALESKVEGQQSQLNLQNEQIKQLLIFSMSWYTYEMFYQLQQAKTYKRQYIHRDDGSMNRNLRFLIEHGYIEEIFPWPVDGEDLTSKFQPTRTGIALLEMRGAPNTPEDLHPK